jgi:glycosyltransferase involved in cell wall biosynthesis
VPEGSQRGSAAGKPRVSVIIPTYNRAGDIGRCLDSLVGQTMKDFEVLVCDDGSTDDTAEVVSRYQDKLDLRYHWAENFGGPARPRNIGLSLARAEYVAFLDSDDWWTPQKLEVSLEYLQRGADVVHHDLYLVTKSGQKVFWRKSSGRELQRPVFDDLIVNGNGVNNSSLVARRSLLEAIGGFSEHRDLIAAEDYDAWLRLGKISDAFVRIPRTLGYYWVGHGNLSNPQRQLQLLDVLEERYSQEFKDLGARHSIYWLNYTKARSHFVVGAYEMARRNLAATRWRRSSPSIRMKVFWMLVMIRFHNARA